VGYASVIEAEDAGDDARCSWAKSNPASTKSFGLLQVTIKTYKIVSAAPFAFMLSIKELRMRSKNSP